MKNLQEIKDEIRECKEAILQTCTNGDYLTGYISALSAVEGMLAELRSNCGVSADWIPVSERLPDKEWGYIVTCNNYDSDFCIYVPGKGFGMYSDGKWHSADDEVTEWMPLPEPYKGVE